MNFTKIRDRFTNASNPLSTYGVMHEFQLTRHSACQTDSYVCQSNYCYLLPVTREEGRNLSLALAGALPAWHTLSETCSVVPQLSRRKRNNYDKLIYF